jgi:hypothetical protein
MKIIVDSHARGYAANLLSYFDKVVEVMGTVMPGARLEDIIKTNIKEIRALGKNGVVIVCGGSTNINKN